MGLQRVTYCTQCIREVPRPFGSYLGPLVNLGTTSEAFQRQKHSRCGFRQAKAAKRRSPGHLEAIWDQGQSWSHFWGISEPKTERAILQLLLRHFKFKNILSVAFARRKPQREGPQAIWRLFRTRGNLGATSEAFQSQKHSLCGFRPGKAAKRRPPGHLEVI